MKKLNFYGVLFFILLFISNKTVSQSSNAYLNFNLSKKSVLKTQMKSDSAAKFFARVYLGNAFSAGPSYIGYNETHDFMNNIDEEEVVNCSYGGGMFFGAGIGYPLCPNFAVNLEANVFRGRRIKLSDMYVYPGGSSSGVSETSIRGLNLRPSAIILTNPCGRLTPFGEVGLNLPVMSTMRSTFTATNNNNTYIYTDIIKPKFKIGVYAGLGANYQVTESLGITASLQAQVQSFTPKHGFLDSYTENGVDKLSELKTYDKETDYVDQQTTTNTAPDLNKPYIELAKPQPYSSLNLSLGLSYNLGRYLTKQKEHVDVAPKEEPVVVNVKKPDEPQPCVCAGMSIKSNQAGNPTRTLNMEKSYNKAMKNYSFKITVMTNVDMACGASTLATPCEGTFVIEITTGGALAGFRKVISTQCSTTKTLKDTAVSFHGSSATSAGLDKIKSNVVITFIMICNGQVKRISQTMEIMTGDLVNSNWGKWEEVKPEEAKQIQKTYENK